MDILLWEINKKLQGGYWILNSLVLSVSLLSHVKWCHCSFHPDVLLIYFKFLKKLLRCDLLKCNLLLQVVLFCNASCWPRWRETTSTASSCNRAPRKGQSCRGSQYCSSDVLFSCCWGCEEKNVHKTLQGGKWIKLWDQTFVSAYKLTTNCILSPFTVGRCFNKRWETSIWSWKGKKGIFWQTL